MYLLLLTQQLTTSGQRHTNSISITQDTCARIIYLCLAHDTICRTILIMQSAATVVGALGLLLLTALSLCGADIYPGDGVFRNIHQEMINNVAADSIPLRHFCGERG